MDERIVNLESRLAFYEDTQELLSQALSKQQRRIDRLEEELASLHIQLQQINAATPEAAQDEPPPPHY